MQLPALGRIHDRYLALAHLASERRSPSLAGSLLLRSSADAEGLAILLAAGLAGAASLCLDPDPERLRESLRRGLCDFVVADLSEALRILKNEIRRRRAVSVAVTAPPELCLGQMLERGVQPDLFSIEASPHAVDFLRRGALPLPAPAPDADTSILCWTSASDPARTLPRLAQLASESLDDTRSGTAARRHWLASAPRYLGRAFRGCQCLRMTPAEAARFEARARAEVPGAVFEPSQAL